MAYTNVNMDEIDDISFTLYHNTSDGRKNVGFYNPTTQNWIGYYTGGSSGTEQGVNQETGYTTTTNLTSYDTWMMDGQEITVTITITTTDMTINYESMNNTANTVTIPLGSIDKTSYYFAVQDYRGYGMYIKDITINGGGNKSMKTEQILHATGSDTSNWKTIGGSTVPTKTVTIGDNTITATTTTTDNGQWNNTYLDKEIPLNGHYILNTEVYHTENRTGYWNIEFLQSPLTKKDDNAYNLELCYIHEYNAWTDNTDTQISTSSDAPIISKNTWTLLSFDINNGKITVTYNDTIVDLGTLTNPVYFSMRTWYHDGNICCGNIELRKYLE